MKATKLENKETIAFARRITELGFTVYVAQQGEGSYGFVTDKTESRVLSFSIRDGKLSGNYGPPSSTDGTGWVMQKNIWDLKTREDVLSALYERPPTWAHAESWKYLSNVNQYLAMYQSSSHFKIFQSENLLAKYLENEESNYHSENMVLLAENFGTDKEKQKAAELLAQRDWRGHAPPETSEFHCELEQKYRHLLKGVDSKNASVS